MIFKTTGNDITLFENKITELPSKINTLRTAFTRYNNISSKSATFQNAYNNALSKSDSSIAKYLVSLNGAKASLGGYIKSLIGAKAAEIGLKAATIALNTALTMGLSIAINGIITVIQNTITAQEKAREKALELTESYKEQQASLDSQIEKYKELKQSLVSGNLSTDEARSVKEQLLEIQKSLIESYGNEVSSIDLVNGKYKEQLGLLRELSKDKATDYVSKNKGVFSTAKKELEKVRTYNIGSIGWNDYTSKSDVESRRNLEDYLKKYGLEYNNIGSDQHYGTHTVNFSVKANVENADEIMQQLYVDLEKYGKKNDIDVSGLLEGISEQRNKTWTDELTEYKTVYDEFMKAEIVRNDTLRPLYQQSIQAVEDYNSALSTGKGVEEAKSKLDSIQQSVKNATNELEGSQDVFDDIFDGVNKDAEAIYNLDAAFTNNRAAKYYAEQLRGLSDIDLQAINLDNKNVEKGEEAFRGLITTLGLAENQTQGLIDKLVELGYVSGKVQQEASSATFSDIFKLKNSESSLTELGKINEELDKFQKAYTTLKETMDSYNVTGTFTLDQVQEIISLGDEYLKYLMDENGKLKLNKEALNNVAAARINEMRAKALSNLMDNLENIKNEDNALEYLKTQLIETAKSYDDFTKSRINAWSAKALDSGMSIDTVEKVSKAFSNQASAINQMFDKISIKSVYTSSSKSSKDATEEITKRLDAELKVLDAKMDAGLLDFKQYMNQRTNLISKYYKNGKIKAADYYKYLHDNYEKEISYMDKAVSAVNKILDDRVKSLEKEKEQIEESYNLRIKKLEETKTAIEDANTARKNALELEKAAYEFERAKSQRVNKVLTGDKGFIYTADNAAVKDAKDELDDLEYQKQIDELEKSIQSLQDEMDSLTNNIDKQITALNEYKEKWNDIANQYEDTQNHMIAVSIFGQNVEADILAMRTDILNEFADNYVARQQEMAEAAIRAAEAEKYALDIAGGATVASISNGDKDGKGSNVHVVIPYGDGTDPRLNKAKPTREKEDEEEKKRRNGVNAKNRAFYIMGQGGVVGSGNSSPIAKKVGEDATIFVKNGERILTPTQNKNFELFISQLPEFIKGMQQMPVSPMLPGYASRFFETSNITNNSSRVVNQIINVSMPNITDSSSALEIMRDLNSLSTKMLQAF